MARQPVAATSAITTLVPLLTVILIDSHDAAEQYQGKAKHAE